MVSAIDTNLYIEKTSEYLSSILDVSVAAIAAILPRAFLFSVFTFLFAVVLLWIVGRRGLFKRKNQLWNIISKIHYVLWTVIFIAAGFTYGGISATSKEVHVLLEDTFRPYVESSLPALKEYLVEKLPDIGPEEKISIEEASQRILQSLYYEPQSEGIIQQVKARGVNWVTLNFGKWIIAYSVSAMVQHAAQTGGHALHLSDETIEFTKNTIKEMDLSQVDKNIAQIVYEAVDSQVKAVFRNYQIWYIVFFSVLLGIACIEPGIYFLWWEKRSHKDAI